MNADQIKPFLRGHFHQAGFFVALGASSVLVASAANAHARFAALIYGICLSALLGISGLYHRVNWSPRARVWWRRLDHAAIFLLIAGTITPVCLLGLQGGSGPTMLELLWFGAGLGIIKEMFWTESPKWISSLLYVGVGWLIAPYIPEMQVSLGNEKAYLLITGGIIYTLGAVTYALKKPNPFPKVFGYHEVFHALVLVAGICHFIVIYQLVRSA